jgi:hypothetical protein
MSYKFGNGLQCVHSLRVSSRDQFVTIQCAQTLAEPHGPNERDC